MKENIDELTKELEVEKSKHQYYFDAYCDALNKHRNNSSFAYYFKDIANTQENKDMIKFLRKHLNKELQIRIRGRGTRKLFGNQYSIDLTHAQTFAIYIDKKKCK